MRECENRTQLAYHLGVRTGFLSKWWAVWKVNKTWESLRDRSSRPKNIISKKWEYTEPIIELRKAHLEMGAQKIKAILGVDLNH